MPIILLALVGGGLIVAVAALVYYWGTPAARRPPTDGKPLLVLGIFFIVWSMVYAVTDVSNWYVWGPVGIVFLAVGLRQNRQSRDSQSGS